MSAGPAPSSSPLANPLQSLRSRLAPSSGHRLLLHWDLLSRRPAAGICCVSSHEIRRLRPTLGSCWSEDRGGGWGLASKTISVWGGETGVEEKSLSVVLKPR